MNRRFDKLEDVVKKNTEQVTQIVDQLRREDDSADRENIEEALKNWKAALEKALNTCNKKLTAHDSKSTSV